MLGKNLVKPSLTFKKYPFAITPKEIATDEMENDDYYSRVFSQTTRMITNKGCLEVKGKNIDVIQIIQKG